MTSNIAICNSALVMVGANQINSFSDSSREAELCSAIYEVTKKALLQKYPWAFTLEQIDLARTIETPLYDYQYSYQLPPNSLRVIQKNNLPSGYRIFKDNLFADDESVTIISQVDPGEGEFPAYFTRALELKMAELLSVSLIQDESLSQLFERKYVVALREARSVDGQSDPTQGIDKTQFAIASIRSS